MDAGTFTFNALQSGDGQRRMVTGEFLDSTSGLSIQFETIDQITESDFLGRMGFGGLATLDGVAGYRYAVMFRDNGGPDEGLDRFDVHVIEADAPNWDNQIYTSNGCGLFAACADANSLVTSGDIRVHEHR